MAITRATSEYEYPTVYRNFVAQANQRISNIKAEFAEADRDMQQTAKQTLVGQTARSVTARGIKTLRKSKRRKTTARALTRAKVRVVNPWVLGMFGTFYLSLQLPFASFTIQSLGLLASVYELISSTVGDGVTSYLVSGIAETFTTIAGAVGSAFEILGLSFDPSGLFAIGFIVILSFGWSQFLAAWFIYSMAGLNALSGRGAALKIGTFLLAAFGMFVPVLNLFPLTLLWGVAVWFYPK